MKKDLNMSDKKVTIIYDLSTVPDGWELSDVMYGYKEMGVIIYDGRMGNAPVVLDEETEVIDIRTDE